MKKLMIFCFSILFTVLSALSCVNFSLDAVERMEKDKATILIEEPEGMSNKDFLARISDALGRHDIDIMYRYISEGDGKPEYMYYKTNHTDDFLEISAGEDMKRIEAGECISTMQPEGYNVYQLFASDLLQDISIYPWEDAEKYDLSGMTCYVKSTRLVESVEVLEKEGFTVTPGNGAYISGKFSVTLFGLVPAFMLITSIVFYTLSNGKKNVLKKIDGCAVPDILWDEIKATIPALGICFVVIAIIHDGIALRLYPKAFFQYFCYSVQYLAFGLMVLLCGIFVAAFLVLLQKSAEHVKGRVPRRGIYVTSVLAKCVFVIFIVFFLSIAVRNAFTAYNTVQTSQYLADKIAGYVTVPVNINNASSQGLEENYKEFYAATVERYHGILIDASNYEYDLISGETPEEAYGQDSITVNINYLDFNPIYDGTGKQITESMLSNSAFNVLIPASKSNVESRYREYVETAYGKQPNFITYDDGNSHIYSYNANIGTGGNGELDSPVILVAGEDDLEGIFVLSYCSSGSYILNEPKSDPYQKLLPLLRETGIAPVTLDTPPVSDTFTDTIRQQSSMLVLYGGQSVILLAGLIGLILFSARLFCENYRKRIAASLIEGSTVLSCIRGHLIVTVLYYCTAVIAVSVLSLMMQVTLNQYILIVAFLAEIIITYRICRKNAHQNLYQIVKGAE